MILSFTTKDVESPPSSKRASLSLFCSEISKRDLIERFPKMKRSFSLLFIPTQRRFSFSKVIFSETSDFLKDLKAIRYKWANKFVELIIARNDVILQFDRAEPNLKPIKPIIIPESGSFIDETTTNISIHMDSEGVHENDKS